MNRLEAETAEIINHLMTKYSLNNDQVQAGLDRNGRGFTRKVTTHWISGRRKPNRRGRDELARFFSTYNPDVEPFWFEGRLEEVKKQLKVQSQHLTIDFSNIRIDPMVLKTTAELLEGIWHTKRMAYDNSGRIVREVLNIGHYENGHVRISILGVTNRGIRSDKSYIIERYDGELVQIGNLVNLISTYSGSNYQRLRQISFHSPVERGYAEKLLWGIANGFSSLKQEPAAARILLIRSRLKMSDIERNPDRYLGFRELKNADSQRLRLLSNDIIRHNTSKADDHILTVSRQDLHELADNKIMTAFE